MQHRVIKDHIKLIAEAAIDNRPQTLSELTSYLQKYGVSEAETYSLTREWLRTRIVFLDSKSKFRKLRKGFHA